ncbi:MAG: MBOAT family protein [Candidatus Abyssobacteria bacterium SURF_5]|uniref:MBOAT family protein n=1 Tax=Abyssobacteria bacterium (strain SURF_5) TaxID=2093360 RepID=A0A3A4NLB0_ABYX5|nr:MAG: MBOAT family protein [Candidatus Abyssubacteria bacterium SURF_5]
MRLLSIHFFALVAAGLLLFHGYNSRNWRRAVLLILNVAFIASFAGDFLDLLPLIEFLSLGYFCICFIHARPSKLNFFAAIFLLIATFIYLKQYSLVHFLTSAVSPGVTIGLSFIFFRVLQVLVDTYQRALVERISPWQMLNYCCNFLTFVSGPIQRFQDYRKQEESLGAVAISSETAYLAFSRITNGVIKLAIISAGFQLAFQWARYVASPNYLWATYGAACLSYLLQLYFNFAGYMDIVIGVGLLFGFELPENFDAPLGAGNFLDFWRRWHITLSEWFKLYLFNPIMKSLAHRSRRMSLIPYFGVFAYFITFFLMGVWHGTTFVFVIYGLFLGLGMSVNKLYEIEMRKRLGKDRFKKLRGATLYGYFTHALTMTYFAVSLTALWTEWDGFTKILSQLGVLGIFKSAAFCIALVIVSRLLIDSARIASIPIRKQIERVNQAFLFQQAHLAARAIVLLLFLVSSQTKIPDLIYGGF